MGDAASQKHNKPSVRGQGTPCFCAKQFTTPAPRCWGSQLWFTPSKSLPHAFPLRGQPMSHRLLPRALAMGSFSFWLSNGPICLSKWLLLFWLALPKSIFPFEAPQGQQGQLESPLRSGVAERQPGGVAPRTACTHHLLPGSCGWQLWNCPFSTVPPNPVRLGEGTF